MTYLITPYESLKYSGLLSVFLNMFLKYGCLLRASVYHFISSLCMTVTLLDISNETLNK